MVKKLRVRSSNSLNVNRRLSARYIFKASEKFGAFFLAREKAEQVNDIFVSFDSAGPAVLLFFRKKDCFETKGVCFFDAWLKNAYRLYVAG